jgi:uncharacterized membrane protein YdbT with pleckstrin-like domain
MIDLQDDEKVIIEVRKSKAVWVPQLSLLVLVGLAAYFGSWGFYAFRDQLLFGNKGLFEKPQGWLESPINQTIVIFGGLIFLVVAGFVFVKLLQRRSAAKREAEGKPPVRVKGRERKPRKESAEKALVRKSKQRLTSYYNIEKYMMIAVIVLGIAMGLFGFEKVTEWYYVHMTRYILTNKRLVINAGLVSHFFWDLPFDKYDEISGEQNIIERIFNFGDLTVNSVGGSREVILNVPGPQNMRKNFHSVREEYKKQLMGEAMTGAAEEAPEETPGEPRPEEKKPPQGEDTFLNEKPPEDFGA